MSRCLIWIEATPATLLLLACLVAAGCRHAQAPYPPAPGPVSPAAGNVLPVRVKPELGINLRAVERNCEAAGLRITKTTYEYAIYGEIDEANIGRLREAKGVEAIDFIIGPDTETVHLRPYDCWSCRKRHWAMNGIGVNWKCPYCGQANPRRDAEGVRP